MDKEKILKSIRRFEDNVRVIEVEGANGFFVPESEVNVLLTLIKHELKEKPYIVITANAQEEVTSLKEGILIKEMYAVLGRNAVIKQREINAIRNT